MADAVFREITISPDEVLAGDAVEFVVRFVVGPDYTDGPSRLVLSCPGMLGQSRVSVHNWEQDGFSRLYISKLDVEGRCRAWNSEIMEFPSEPPSDRFKAKGEWGQRFCVIDLGTGLEEGDVVEWHWGDIKRGHSRGCNISIVAPIKDFQPVIDIAYYTDQTKGIPDLDRDYKGNPRPVPDARFTCSYTVRPREAARIRVLRTARRAVAVPLDRFWNVSEARLPELVEADADATQNEGGGWDYPPNVNVRSRSLPLMDCPPTTNVFEGMNIYWGDIHTHSAFSVDCLEREKMPLLPGDLMRSARDRVALDFYGLTDHHINWLEEHYLIGEDRWNHTMEAIEKHHKEGEFVVIPGTEFGDIRCDTNLHFNYMPEYSEIDHPWKDVRDIWAALDGRDYMSIPHFHRKGKMPDGEWWECPSFETEPVMEVYSTHGVFDRTTAPPWTPLKRCIHEDRNMVWMHEQGYRYGVIGGSDGHKGHVGLSGLTGVYATELTRDAIFEAHRLRRTYATTNARVRLLFTGNGALMGSELPNTDEKVLGIHAVTEAPIKAIELLRCGNVEQRFTPGGVVFDSDVAVRDERPGWWQARVWQVDDQFAISSPVWFG